MFKKLSIYNIVGKRSFFYNVEFFYYIKWDKVLSVVICL